MTTSTIQSVSLLPVYFQTSKNAKFLSSTIDQLIQPTELERLNAFIGSTSTPTYKVGDNYIQEDSGLRQAYQLTPALVTRDINSVIQGVTAIDDLVNEISTAGGITDNFDRLFRSESYSYYPQVNWDKLVNYQDYYWLPTGPKLIEFDQDKLDVANVVVGQTTATLTVGSQSLSLANGMLVTFSGQGVDPMYQYREFFVEGVGTSIQLIPYDELITPESIASPGLDLYDTDNFDTYAFDNDRNMPIVPEYVTINRASTDRNSWSRYNRWVSADVIASSSLINGESVELPASQRATRPIVEFNANIQLYNFGSTAIKPVDLVDTTTKEAFLTISGSSTSTGVLNTATTQIDGVNLEHGMRVIFTADLDVNVRSKIYKVEIVTTNKISKVALLPDDDTDPAVNSSVLVTQGTTNGGSTWWFNGTDWVYAQQHTYLNQSPLFDLFDSNGISYSDVSMHQTNFHGNKIFGYSINNNNTVDPVLGLKLNYRNLNTVGSFLFENYFSESSIVISNPDLSTVQVPTISTYFKINGDLVNVWSDLIAPPIVTDSNGYYELPLSLTNNPLNGNLNYFTLSDLTEHANTNQRLVANGINPIAFAMMFIGKKNNSAIDSIIKSAEAYNYFKLTLINSLSSGINFPNKKYYNNPKLALDTIVRNLNVNKTAQSPYYLSDMMAYADEKQTINYTVTSALSPTYPLLKPFDINVPSFRTIYVYLNNKLLTYNVDYTFDSIDGTVVISHHLNQGDLITVDDYYDTRGSFIPPTPTKLGLYPAFVPQMFMDNTYSSGPVNVIQGHDGSLMVAFNDYRDAIILEYEKRIYNNIKVAYRNNLFDVNSVKPGAFRNSDYSISEVNSIIESDFIRWAGEYGIDYASNNTYDSANPFTWNYDQSFNQKLGIPVNGSWRAVFDYFYDTDRPNTNPWEMLGFISQPDWWVSEYGPAPYTSGNNVMWGDIEAGRIAQGPTAGVNTFYARPGLSKILPVDDNGDLLDPVTIGLIGTYNPLTIGYDWAIGDRGPAETAWRRSSYWPFVVQRLTALTKPATYSALMYDPYNMKINAAGQWTYGDNESFIQLNNVPIHGENTVATSGYSVFVSEINRQRTQNYIQELRQDLQYADFNLFHKVGGFINKNTLQIIIDAYEPTTPAPGAILPNESYNLILNSSNPITTVGISGIIIQRVNGNFVVRGYDRTTPYFNYYKPVRNRATPSITVGGVTAQYVTWQPYSSTGANGLSLSQTTTARSAPTTSFYQKGQIVQYGSNYYRVLVSHQAEAVFDSTLYQILDTLPTTGGATVQLADVFDKTIVKVPYGTTFTSVQALYDMIVGYGAWLSDQGFVFDQFNQDLGVVNDWGLSAKEFLYWTTQNWDTNNVISISPFADQIKFQKNNAVVDNIFNSFYNYSIARADGTPFPKNNLFVARQNGVFTINTINTTEGIYFAQLNCIQKEHAIVFDNTDIFGDVIYDIQTGERQERMKLVGFRTSKWNGDFFAPGFVYDEALAVNWTPYTNYLASSIVKYNGLYYSAKKNINSSSTFDFTKWNNLGTQPVAGLLPNFDYKIGQFNDFYSLDIDNFDLGQQQAAQNLIGYIPRTYLNNVFTDPISQYKFYQGYIKDKGTSNAIAKLSKASLNNLGSVVGYREEWAFRVGQYGSFTTYNEYEAPLHEGTFKENPQIVTFVTPDQVTNDDLIYYITPSDLAIGAGSLPSIATTSSSNDAFKLIHAGYVRIDDVNATAYNQNSLLDIANNGIINDGTTIWLGFTPNGSWDVLRYTFHSASIIDVNASQPYSAITFTTSVPHGLSATQIISIVDFNSEVDGIYQITSVPSSTEFTVPSTLSSIDFPNPASPGFLFTFESSRFPTFDQLPSDQKLYKYKNGSFIWVDSGNNTDNNGWAVYEKVLNYTNTVTSELSTPVDEGFGFSIHKPKGQSYVLIGSPKFGTTGAYTGGAGLYQSTNNALIPITIYQPSLTPGNNNQLGYSVFYDDMKFHGSLYGLMFAGAPGSYNNSGTVRISSIDTIFNEKLQMWLTNPGSSTAQFGSSLFVQRNTATKFTLVGAPMDTDGVVHAYAINGTTATVTATYISTVQPSVTLTSNSQWGYAIAGSDDASVIAIGAPYHANSGTVQVFYNLPSGITPGVALVSSSTFQAVGAQFGYSIALSTDFNYLAVGAPGVSNSDGSVGAVGIFTASGSTYVLEQIITNPVTGLGMKFGQAVAFDDNLATLVVTALGTNTNVSTTFDVDTEIFDLDTTRFVEEEPQSGSVYVYNRQNTRYIYSEELINAIESITTGTDYGTSVAVDGNIIVGAPGISGNIVSNVYQFTKINSNIAGWNQIRVQDDLVLPEAVQRICLINTATNSVVNYYDYVDPLKGKILGIADKEITYKMPSDPAIYSVGTDSVNVNTNASWVDDHVGELWWDISTAKYVWYEQGNLEFRRSNWNKLFPGATIDVYEWVESTLLPSDWAVQADTAAGLTKGISGQPRNVDNSTVSVKQVYDAVTNSFSNVYYFWVKNKVTVPNVANRKVSAFNVATYIANPTEAGIQHVSIISSNTIMLSNLGLELESDKISINLAIDNSFSEIPKHTEWALVQHGLPEQILPSLIEKKILDSLVGHDILGNPVPDPTLSERAKYGISIRPQQTLFKDRFTALRNIITYANSVLIGMPIADTAYLGNLLATEAAPTQYTTVEDTNELGLISTSTTATVTVLADSYYNNGWAVYGVNTSTYTWQRIQTQSFNTPAYWSYTDWASNDYNPYKDITAQIADPYVLSELKFVPGQYVRVNNLGNGNYAVLEQVNTSTQTGNFGNNFNVVYLQNGTIQFLDTLWNQGYGFDETYTYNQTLYDQTPDTEIRTILNSLKKDIFVGDLAVHWNNIFFIAVKYAMTEHPFQDWVFKTSFINVTNLAGKLSQPAIYKLQDSVFYENYIKEVKPYHTQIREFRTQYSYTDTSRTIVSDFDFPSSWSFTKGNFVAATVSATDVMSNPVREIDTTLIFDRVGTQNQIGSLPVTDKFVGDGATAEFPLSWVAQPDKSKIVVTLTGQFVLPTNYTIKYYTEEYNGYEKSYSSLVFLDTIDPPGVGVTISVTYQKATSMMTAVERIQNYYAPTSGMPGASLDQLMVGATDPRSQIGGQYEGKFTGTNTFTNFININAPAMINSLTYDTLVNGGPIYPTFISNNLVVALGIDPTELNIDGGYNFISTVASPAPEEVVPGFTADTLGIDVYTKPLNTPPVILDYSQRIVATTTNITIDLTTRPTTIESIIVTFNDIEFNYQGNSLFTLSNQFTIDWQNNELIVAPQITDGRLSYTIMGVGDNTTSGIGLIDKASQPCNGTTSTEVTGLASYFDVVSAYVTVDGVPISQGFTSTTAYYDLGPANASDKRATALVYNLNPAASHGVQAWFFGSLQNNFNKIQSQSTPWTTASYPLIYAPDTTYGPPSDQVIVELTTPTGVTTRLRPPYTTYYTVQSTATTTYPIVDLTNTNFVSFSTNTNVYQNGVLLTYGSQYTLTNTTTVISSQLNLGDIIAVEVFNPTNIFNTVTNNASYSYDYMIGFNSFFNQYYMQLSPNYWGSNYSGSTVKITSFTNQDSMLIQTQTFVGNPRRTFKLDRPVLDSAYVWVTINVSGSELILTNEVDYQMLPDHMTVLVSDAYTIAPTDSVVIMSFASPTVSNEVLGYRIFNDILGRTSYKRLSNLNSTYLTQPLTFADTSINVADATVLTPPDIDANIPGVVLIDGERIEFFEIQGNSLTQLKRGTLGTSPAQYLEYGTKVIDQGTYQTLPVSADPVLVQNTFTNASLGNTYVISTTTVVGGWYNSITSSTVKCDGIKFITTATLGTLPYDPYTGDLKYGVRTYSVSTASIEAKDQVQVYYGGYQLRKNVSYWHDTTVAYDSIDPSQIVGTVPTASALSTVTNYFGNAYVCQDTGYVYVCTLHQYSSTATSLYIDSGLRQTPADFYIINTSTTPTLILNTATVKLHTGTLLSIVMKHGGPSWNDADPANPMINTLSILTSTNVVAQFLREGPALLPDNSFYGGNIELQDNSGTALTDQNGNPLLGF